MINKTIAIIGIICFVILAVSLIYYLPIFSEYRNLKNTLTQIETNIGTDCEKKDYSVFGMAFEYNPRINCDFPINNKNYLDILQKVSWNCFQETISGSQYIQSYFKGNFRLNMIYENAKITLEISKFKNMLKTGNCSGAHKEVRQLKNAQNLTYTISEWKLN